MAKRQEEIASKISKTFSDATIKKWDDMVKRWNRDKKAPNPYAEPQCSSSRHFKFNKRDTNI